MAVEPTCFRSCGKCLGEGIVPMKDDYGWWVCGCGAGLVPDTRLQAIADLWDKMTAGYKIWVAPELAALLDALAEDSDE